VAGVVSSLEHCAHLSPALLKQAALVSEGDSVVDVGTRAKMITEFVVGRAEPGGCAWRNRTRAWGRSVV